VSVIIPANLLAVLFDQFAEPSEERHVNDTSMLYSGDCSMCYFDLLR